MKPKSDHEYVAYPVWRDTQRYLRITNSDHENMIEIPPYSETSCVKKTNNGVIVAQYVSDDTTDETICHIFDSDLQLVRTQTIDGELLSVYEANDGYLLFVEYYDGETDVSITRMTRVENDNPWTEGTDLATFFNTDTTPAIFSADNVHVLVWSTNSSTVNIVQINSDGDVLQQKSLTFDHYHFSCCQMDPTWYAIATIDKHQDTIRFDYLCINEDINVFSRFIKDVKYKLFYNFEIFSCDRGFMLLGYGKELYMQRFTHLGMPLYPPLRFNVGQVSDAYFDTGVIHYIDNDFVYKSEHISIDNISEIDDLDIASVM